MRNERYPPQLKTVLTIGPGADSEIVGEGDGSLVASFQQGPGERAKLLVGSLELWALWSYEHIFIQFCTWAFWMRKSQLACYTYRCQWEMHPPHPPPPLISTPGSAHLSCITDDVVCDNNFAGTCSAASVKVTRRLWRRSNSPCWTERLSGQQRSPLLVSSLHPLGC